MADQETPVQGAVDTSSPTPPDVQQADAHMMDGANVNQMAADQNAHPYVSPTSTPTPPDVQQADSHMLDKSGVPTGVKVVAQSEPAQPQGQQGQGQTQTPQRPVLDPRPLAWLAQNDKEKFAIANNVAQEYGVSPQRVAWNWYHESRFGTDGVPRGAAGEIGPVQVMPQTAQKFNNGGRLDVNNWMDNLRIGAGYARYLDDKYGRDSVSSVAAYQGGEGSVNDIAANPGMAMKNHPQTMAYAHEAFPGFNIGSGTNNFTGQSNMTPQGFVQAGTQGGPQGALQYIAQMAPKGMPLSDAWQHAEGMLTQAFLEKGDVEGAQHARDFVLQLSHTGSNMWLMNAHQQLSAGDTYGAAQSLAKAHAFFPDGTIGRFGVDSQGKLYAERLDEHNPNMQVGQPFEVTPDGIAGMLNQTYDPKQYLNTLLEQQKVAIAARHEQVMGDYYASLNPTKVQVANIGAGSREDAATTRANATVSAAEIRAQARLGQGSQASIAKSANAESIKLYSPDSEGMENVDAGARAKLSAIYNDARLMGASGPEADYVAQGVGNGQLKLGASAGDRVAVVDPKKPTAPVAYISKGLADRLAGGSAPQQQGVNTSPIGAGASTPYARAAGVSNNLTGTTTPQQSSAVPTAPGQ